MATDPARGIIQDGGRGATKMNFLRYVCIPAVLLLGALAACNQQQSPQDLREQTAKATAEIKSDAKAMAQGVREGWNRNKPLDLNTATKDQLVSLPDMTESQADRVIAGRPYDSPNDLVKRHILPKAEYDKIADQVTAKR
jgi:competence protein ComEA